MAEVMQWVHHVLPAKEYRDKVVNPILGVGTLKRREQKAQLHSHA